MAAPGAWKPFVPPAVFVPVAVALRLGGASDLLVFAAAGVALLPLSSLMGRATEELAKRAGPGIGGFLNATLGNATELIIGLAAILQAGAEAAAGRTESADSLIEVVKASISGSIIGNLLLVLGLSLFLGGLRHKKQTFSVHNAELQVTMLALAIAALVMPELFQLSYQGAGGVPPALPNVSLWIAVILLVGYALGLVFSFHTHRDVFNPVAHEEESAAWSGRFALATLIAATVLIMVIAELLVGSVEALTASLGLTPIFVGVVIIAILGNAAEHASAIQMAWKDKMDLSVGIATVSSAQVALFVTPILVLASVAIRQPLTLAFEIFELVAIILSVAVVGIVAKDGETNWYEGVLLLLLYGIIVVGFFFHP